VPIKAQQNESGRSQHEQGSLTSISDRLLVLAKIGPPAAEAIPALTETCLQSNLPDAIGARFALVMITGDVEKHLRPICKALESSDVVFRRIAALSIGMIGDKALPAARKLFEMWEKETDPHARAAAWDALKRIGWDPAIGAMPDIDYY